MKAERRFKGATPGGRPGAAGGTGTKASGEADPCTHIIPQRRHETQDGGRVLLVLEPGSLPTVRVEAATEREQAALSELVATARRLAGLVGSVTT